jgi:opacity protein-like surface antigen
MRVLPTCSAVVVTLSLCLAAPAFASEPFAPGAYVGVNLSSVDISSKYVESGHDISGGLAIGYQATPNFGVEIFTRSLSVNPFKGFLAAPGYYPDDHYGVAVLGSAPINEQFSIYGRAGIGRTKMQSTRTSLASYHETDPSIGIGASYAFNRQWSVNLEASRLTKTDVNFISAGVRFQF